MTLANDSLFLAATIGPSFIHELRTAELNHIALSINSGGIILPAETSQSDIDSIQALIDAHDPQSPDPDAYKTERARAYPHIGDQLDELMKWIAASSDPTLPQGLKDMAQNCMDVKAQYPKPAQTPAQT